MACCSRTGGRDADTRVAGVIGNAGGVPVGNNSAGICELRSQFVRLGTDDRDARSDRGAGVTGVPGRRHHEAFHRFFSRGGDGDRRRNLLVIKGASGENAVLLAGPGRRTAPTGSLVQACGGRGLCRPRLARLPRPPGGAWRWHHRATDRRSLGGEHPRLPPGADAGSDREHPVDAVADQRRNPLFGHRGPDQRVRAAPRARLCRHLVGRLDRGGDGRVSRASGWHSRPVGALTDRVGAAARGRGAVSGRAEPDRPVRGDARRGTGGLGSDARALRAAARDWRGPVLCASRLQGDASLGCDAVGAKSGQCRASTWSPVGAPGVVAFSVPANWKLLLFSSDQQSAPYLVRVNLGAHLVTVYADIRYARQSLAFRLPRP